MSASFAVDGQRFSKNKFLSNIRKIMFRLSKWVRLVLIKILQNASQLIYYKRKLLSTTPSAVKKSLVSKWQKIIEELDSFIKKNRFFVRFSNCPCTSALGARKGAFPKPYRTKLIFWWINRVLQCPGLKLPELF